MKNKKEAAFQHETEENPQGNFFGIDLGPWCRDIKHAVS